MKFNIKAVLIALGVAISVMVIIRIVTVMLEGEEGRLKRTIYKAKKLAERENIVGLTNYISPQYNDEFDNDRRTLLLITKDFFDEYKNILILINDLAIAIDEDNATTQIEATVYWQEPSVENINYDSVKVEAGFKKDNNRWQLIELKFFELEKKRLFNPMVG
jgi:hypothetical protein